MDGPCSCRPVRRALGHFSGRRCPQADGSVLGSLHCCRAGEAQPRMCPVPVPRGGSHVTDGSKNGACPSAGDSPTAHVSVPFVFCNTALAEDLKPHQVTS